eukprot:CAMPEP_0170178378 /NCGR_PEP_ID=MMETSP0040_2-20121228/11839_1 /TAXON_ID=641309 /ORGANISM="Lotharella oceanica, Strain CCMP622" /LENGTH=314 /DNA_ID=CAMNT_0010421411 /DNA_START=17 /DNA_END=961 /DNA_ORIENTATION=+
MPRTDSTEEKGQTEGQIDKVQIDGLALLKIIKHCDENKGESVNGQLLGLHVDSKLEVTNSFPGLPAEEKADHEAFLDVMMKLLKQVNVDNNSVGWYQSAFIGEWIDNDIIRTHYNFQSKIPESVVLIYDPYTTTKGNLAVKTYRLTQKFMRFYKSKDFSHVNFAKHRIDSSDIFEEVPMKVHNSHLIHAFLYELQCKDKFSCTFDRLELTGDMLFKRNLDIMSNSIDDLLQDQNKFSFYQRQRVRAQAARNRDKTDGHDEGSKKNLPYLGRMDAYLTAQKITHYSKKVRTMVGQSMTKMFEVDALNRVHQSNES